MDKELNDKYPFTFGRMVIDLKHEFFGDLDPSVFVIADPSASEEDGDEEVWADHYRAHMRFKFKDLRDTSRFKVLGFVDPTKPVYEQMKQAEDEFEKTSECVALVEAYSRKYHPERFPKVTKNSNQ